MKLLIDAGNSYIKWALIDGSERLHSDMVPIDQAGEFTDLFCVRCGKPRSYFREIEQIWVSNVAGEKVSQQIRNIKFVKPDQIFFVTPQESQCGVSNGYDRVEQLGIDRWVSLIAAWRLVQGKCLVVNSGTATTIDALSERGEFLGGLIIPGIELMQRCLLSGTDRLKSEVEDVDDVMLHGRDIELFPKNTGEAMFIGAILATSGAIERQYASLGDETAPVVLSGGSASLLKKNLNMPLNFVDNLVLQGLQVIAEEMQAR